nr:MAG TPA: helix-turn-helix domain protein [Bacteriophage sp.]
MTKEEIGAVLKGLRTDNGKTQKEVAEILGRTQQIIGHWETGYSQPDANTLFRLCEIYGTTVDEAFGFKKEKQLITKKDIHLLRKYHELDNHGKEMVDFTLEKEYERSKALAEHEDNNIVEMPSYLEVNAASHDKNSTPEERQAGDSIMSDDSEWE